MVESIPPLNNTATRARPAPPLAKFNERLNRSDIDLLNPRNVGYPEPDALLQMRDQLIYGGGKMVGDSV